MKAETVYVVTEVSEDTDVVLATTVFDEALDATREFPYTPGATTHRYIDVWRSGDIAHTLFFGEDGLETAEKAVEEVVPA